MPRAVMVLYKSCIYIVGKDVGRDEIFGNVVMDALAKFELESIVTD